MSGSGGPDGSGGRAVTDCCPAVHHPGDPVCWARRRHSARRRPTLSGWVRDVLAVFFVLLVPVVIAAPALGQTFDPTAGITASGDAGSAGAVVRRIVADIEPGFYTAAGVILHLLGILAIGQGMLRLLRHGTDHLRGPSATGTALTFVLAAVLLALPSFLGGASETLLGTNTVTGRVLTWGSADSSGAHTFQALLEALFAIVAMLGLIAFVRGWFVLRAAADGAPHQTMGSACWHIVGGICAWHMPTVIAAVQQTAGLTVLQVN